jgi:hypothetical protein
LGCHAMKALRRYFVLFNLSDYFATLKSGWFHTETEPLMVIKKPKVFDQWNIVFLKAIIVYTNQKTVYFAFFNLRSSLGIKMVSQIYFNCIKEHAWFFPRLRSGGKGRKWEVLPNLHV